MPQRSQRNQYNFLFAVFVISAAFALIPIDIGIGQAHLFDEVSNSLNRFIVGRFFDAAAHVDRVGMKRPDNVTNVLRPQSPGRDDRRQAVEDAVTLEGCDRIPVVFDAGTADRFGIGFEDEAAERWEFRFTPLLQFLS